MRKTSLLLIVLVGVLLIFYTNMGVFKDYDYNKPYHYGTDQVNEIPQYFEGFYKEGQNVQKLRTMKDYEAVLMKSPLYKSIASNNSSSTNCYLVESKECQKRSDNEKGFMSFKVDPLRTRAQLELFDDWRSEVFYTNEGPNFELKKSLSQKMNLKFGMDPASNKSNVSLDIKW